MKVVKITGDNTTTKPLNQNRMETAVEWLVEEINEKAIINGTVDRVVLNYIIEQSKQMEIEQSHKYAEFAIRCDRKNMKILDFDGYMNLETFKSE